MGEDIQFSGRMRQDYFCLSSKNYCHKVYITVLITSSAGICGLSSDSSMQCSIISREMHLPLSSMIAQGSGFVKKIRGIAAELKMHRKRQGKQIQPFMPYIPVSGSLKMPSSGVRKVNTANRMAITQREIKAGFGDVHLAVPLLKSRAS